MKQPQISVIMTVFNNSTTLAKSIESILQQSFKDFELLIVEDKSEDNSKEIIKKYALQDKRIRPLFNSKNLGISASLNKALKQAKGKYISIQDSDDFSYQNRLELSFNYLEKHKDIFLVGGSIDKIDEQGRLIYRTRRINISSMIIKLILLGKKSVLAHSSVTYRNEGFRYKSIIRGSVDYYFYLNLLKHNKKMKNVSSMFAQYTYNTKGYSMSNSYRQYVEITYLRNSLVKDYFFKENNFDKMNKKYFNYLLENMKNQKIKLKIKNLYRIGEYNKGNSLMWKYIKRCKKIPFKFLVLYVLSFFYKDILRRA